MLDIQLCDVTDVAVIAIAQRCPQLRDLNMLYCSLITDLSINEIALRCKELVSLHCSKCPLVTFAAQTNVVLQCPKLQLLHFAGEQYSAEYYRLKDLNTHVEIK